MTTEPSRRRRAYVDALGVTPARRLVPRISTTSEDANGPIGLGDMRLDGMGGRHSPPVWRSLTRLSKLLSQPYSSVTSTSPVSARQVISLVDRPAAPT